MALVTSFGIEELDALRGLAEGEDLLTSWAPVILPYRYCQQCHCADPLLVHVAGENAWYRHGEALCRVSLTPFSRLAGNDFCQLVVWLDAIHPLRDGVHERG